MKVTLSQKNLKQALSITEKIVSKNSSLPILNNVLIKTENGRVKISATNLEVGVNCSIGAKIEEQGEIAVPVRIFSDFINNIHEEKVGLQAKNNTLFISSEKYKTQILGFDPKDFPIIPKIKTEPFSTIAAKVLKNSLASVIDSVSLSETRPELAGVYIQFTDKNICFASTDSFRLSERIIDLKNKNTISLIIPRNTILELIRICGEVEGDINLRFSDNQISFSNEDVDFVSRVIDGNYPPYKNVIPEKYISRAILSKDELEKKARLAGLFSSHISDIKVMCDKKSTQIMSRNSDKGEISIELESELSNEPFDVSLNYHYLLDGLKIIPTDKVALEFTGKGGPLIIRPEGQSKDLTYLIMPLRN